MLAALVLGYGFLYLNIPKRSYGDSFVFDMSRYFSFFITTLFALGAFVGAAFPAFSNKKTTRAYLLTPASTLEKYTAQLFGRVIVSSLVFLLLFWISAQLARFTAIHSVKTGEMPPLIDVFSYSGLWDRIQKDTFIAWFFPFLLLSIGMYLFAVRLFFNKAGLLKTVLSLFGVIFSIVGLMVLFSHVFYPAETMGWSMKATEYKITKQLSNNEFYTIIITSVSWLFFLVFGYFKLKEKEV